MLDGREAGRRFQSTSPELLSQARMPVFSLALDGEHICGLPAFGIQGFKLGRWDRSAQRGASDSISRDPAPDDGMPLRTFAERYAPEGAGSAIALRRVSSSPPRTSTS